MKINHKTYNLGLMLTGIIIMTTASIGCSSFIERKINIKDVEAELKAATLQEERKLARQIKVKESGIVYKDLFIPKTDNKEFKVLTVRITVYWARGGNTDYWSSKKKSSTGYTLKQGESIAVDPRIIPYKKEVIIPNVGVVKAVDTGSAVIAKTASNGKLPVIDVFFENKKDAILFANKYPKVIKVAVIN
jgi:3D (Asp-Asp-Asp) domain-containing protein